MEENGEEEECNKDERGSERDGEENKINSQKHVTYRRRTARRRTRTRRTPRRTSALKIRERECVRVRERRGGEQNSRRTSDEVLPENLAEGSQRIPPAKNHQRAGHGLTCCPLPLPSGVRRRSRGGNGRRDAGLNQFSPAARARHFRGRHGRERAGRRRRRACRTRCRGRRPYSGVRRRSRGAATAVATQG